MHTSHPIPPDTVRDGERPAPLGGARSTRRGAWLRRLQGMAGTVAVFISIAAGSVVAASEALQDAPGNAVRTFCDAFVQSPGAKQAAAPDAGEAILEGGLQ